MSELGQCTCCTEDFCDCANVPTPLGEPLLCLLTAALPLACSGTAWVSDLDCWCTRVLGEDVCVCSKGGSVIKPWLEKQLLPTISVGDLTWLLPGRFPCTCTGLLWLPGLGATGLMPLAVCDAPACWLCTEFFGFLLACCASGTDPSACISLSLASLVLFAACRAGNLRPKLELPASFAEVFSPPPGRCAGAGAVPLPSELCLALDGARCLDEDEPTGCWEDGRAGAKLKYFEKSASSDSESYSKRAERERP